eukprot:sb/3476290/
MSLPADFERVLLVKPEVSVYKIGPRPNNKGYRAADWNLASPDWTGRMRIVSKGDRCIIRLEDKVTDGPRFSDILGGKDFGWALNRGQIPLISYIGENLSGSNTVNFLYRGKFILSQYR